jgi:hypothetical protein
MHTNESIRRGTKVAASERTHLQAKSSNPHNRFVQGRTDTPGQLHGLTLTERVLGFLERYRPAYGYGFQ